MVLSIQWPYEVHSKSMSVVRGAHSSITRRASLPLLLIGFVAHNTLLQQNGSPF
jgi:hypothetical protein